MFAAYHQHPAMLELLCLWPWVGQYWYGDAEKTTR
jgi:hypothetical protein